MKLSLIAVLLLCALSSLAQDLKQESVSMITSQKTSNHHDGGVFYFKGQTGRSVLEKVRHSYNKQSQEERVVLDFLTNLAPEAYLHIDNKNRLIRIDLSLVDLGNSLTSLGNSEFIESINFFPMNEKKLSLEIRTKVETIVDLFVLNNPARLVLDIKRK